MTADDIRALRKELNLTQRQLAEALKIEVEVVREWEREEHFPTKAMVAAMNQLRGGGGAAPQRDSKPAMPGVMSTLADPKFFALLRKLLHHPRMRMEVERIAAGYADPAE